MTAAAGGTVVLEVRSGRLARAVLGRVAATLAAGADLSVDRIDDLLLVADAVADARLPAGGAVVRAELHAAPGEIAILLGPFPLPAHAVGLLDDVTGGPYRFLERLADEAVVADAPAGGSLVRLVVRSRAATGVS